MRMTLDINGTSNYSNDRFGNSNNAYYFDGDDYIELNNTFFQISSLIMYGLKSTKHPQHLMSFLEKKDIGKNHKITFRY